MSFNKSTLGWMPGGVAAGVALGLIFAPRPGKETRASITEGLLKLRDKYRASRGTRQESMVR